MCMNIGLYSYSIVYELGAASLKPSLSIHGLVLWL